MSNTYVIKSFVLEQVTVKITNDKEVALMLPDDFRSNNLEEWLDKYREALTIIKESIDDYVDEFNKNNNTDEK